MPMNHRDPSYGTSRVDLPARVRDPRLARLSVASLRESLTPSTLSLAGVVSFLTIGGMVVVTAAMIALQIR